MSKYSSKGLTKHLRDLSLEAETMTDEGVVLTKAEALGQLLWNKALGYEEKHPDDPDVTIRHKPENWAIQLIFDRIEGKVPSTPQEEATGLTVADKVSELAAARINAIAGQTTGTDARSGPPDRRPKDG